MTKKIQHQILKFRLFVYKYLLTILGVGSMAFILEACYGVPSDDLYDYNNKVSLKGSVISEDEGKGLENIEVKIISKDQIYNNEAVTDSNGNFVVAGIPVDFDTFNLTFTDIDGIDNGLYLSKDTIIVIEDSDIINASKEIEINLKK